MFFALSVYDRLPNSRFAPMASVARQVRVGSGTFLGATRLASG